MKLSSKLTRCVCGMLCALTVLPTALTGCNKTTDPLYTATTTISRSISTWRNITVCLPYTPMR